MAPIESGLGEFTVTGMTDTPLGVGRMLFLEDFGVPAPGEIKPIAAAARFVEGLRQINGLLAGLMSMHTLKLLSYNALGAALGVGS